MPGGEPLGNVLRDVVPSTDLLILDGQLFEQPGDNLVMPFDLHLLLLFKTADSFLQILDVVRFGINIPFGRLVGGCLVDGAVASVPMGVVFAGDCLVGFGAPLNP